MKEKRTLILLGILVLVMAGGGVWFFMSGSSETTSTKIAVRTIHKPPPKVVKQKPAPQNTKALVKKVATETAQKHSTILGMFPISPGDNYIAGLIDVKTFQQRMLHRLSLKDQTTLKRMALQECGYVIWPTGIQKKFHYSVICSTTGNPEIVKKELTKKRTAIEGTCGKKAKCLKVTTKKGKVYYIGFKDKRFLVISDVASLVASITTSSPVKSRAQSWEKLLPIQKNEFGTLLGSFSATEEGGGMSDFTPSDLGKQSNVNISKLYLRGRFGFIPKGIDLKFKVRLKDKANKDILLSEVPGKVTLFNPSLPSDALIAGADLNALRRSLEETAARYKGKTDPELQKMEGRIFFELSFTNGRPLVYLKVLDLKENGPLLKKLGKPGDEVDITTMLNPFLAMFLGKTSFKRIKGGFVATNLADTNLTPSKSGLANSKRLIQDLSVKNPIAIFAISPARFVEGFIALAKPFVAQNPEMQKNLQNIEQKVKGKNRPERVVFLSKSLTDYEVKIEYNK